MRLALIFLISAAIGLLSIPRLEVCVEQPPGVIHCGNDSPVSIVAVPHFIYLPMVWK